MQNCVQDTLIDKSDVIFVIWFFASLHVIYFSTENVGKYTYVKNTATQVNINIIYKSNSRT